MNHANFKAGKDEGMTRDSFSTSYHVYVHVLVPCFRAGIKRLFHFPSSVCLINIYKQ